VQYWISGLGDWSDYSKNITGEGGPLSEQGPLGYNGPLGDAYWKTLPKINDFGKQLQAMGVWTVLGPLGALGAVGPLGPLGPLGAHGFLRDLKTGAYTHKSATMRNVSVPFNPSGAIRVYDLFEDYESDYALRMRDNDCSWMTSTAINTIGDSLNYTFHSRVPQFITITVVPEAALDDWDLEVFVGGRLIAWSNSTYYMDFVQVAPLATPTTFVVNVKLASSGHILSSVFRLFVVGSTEWIATTDITGAHQKPLGT